MVCFKHVTRSTRQNIKLKQSVLSSYFIFFRHEEILRGRSSGSYWIWTVPNSSSSGRGILVGTYIEPYKKITVIVHSYGYIFTPSLHGTARLVPFQIRLPCENRIWGKRANFGTV